MSGLRQGNPLPPQPEGMTIVKLAVYLQVSKSSLYKLAQDDKIPVQKVRRHWRFHRGTIDNWLAKLGEGDSQI